MSSQRKQRFEYMTFGKRQFDDRCKTSHKYHHCKTSKTVATVVTEVIEFARVVGITVINGGTSCTHKYYISKRQWFSPGAVWRYGGGNAIITNPPSA